MPAALAHAQVTLNAWPERWPASIGSLTHSTDHWLWALGLGPEAPHIQGAACKALGGGCRNEGPTALTP